MRRYVAMSVYLCVAFVVVMTAGLMIFNVPILRLMNTPDEIIGPDSSLHGHYLRRPLCDSGLQCLCRSAAGSGRRTFTPYIF